MDEAVGVVGVDHHRRGALVALLGSEGGVGSRGGGGSKESGSKESERNDEVLVTTQAS